MGEACSDGITKNRVLSSGKEKERNRVRKTEKWIKHYSNSHRILLVGEGDFSFSACLARAFGSANNMVATSLDSKDMLVSKHWTSVANVEELKRSCCLVLHGVNVKDMHKNHRILKRSKFDRIVFNFPHAGYFLFLSETQSELIEIHKELLAAFFRSASELISDDGEIHVSHRNDHPYHQWDLEKLAKNAGLVLIEMAEFCKADYPGYHHKRGDGTKSNRSFPLKEPFTFKFSLNSKSRSLLLNSSVIRSCLISVMRSCLEEIQIYPSNLGSSQQANLKTQLPWMEPGSDTTYCAEALKTNITKQTKMEEREEKYNHTETRIQNPETGGENLSMAFLNLCL